MSDHNSTTDIDLSTLESTRATIPNGERLDGPILVRVDSIREKPLSDNAPLLAVSDRNGNAFDINVWESHRVDVDWQVGDWCIVEATRGRVWQTESGEVKRWLSTTAETSVLQLDLDSEPASIQNPPKVDVSPSNSHAFERRGNGDAKSGDSDDATPVVDTDKIFEEAEEGSIVDNIADEFGQE